MKVGTGPRTQGYAEAMVSVGRTAGQFGQMRTGGPLVTRNHPRKAWGCDVCGNQYHTKDWHQSS